MKQLLKNNKIVAIILISLLFISVSAYLGRGWIRSSGVTWYANTFYQPTLEKRFDEHVGFANQQLEKFGVVVNKDEYSECSGSMYEGIRVSIGCVKHMMSGKVVDDVEFIKNWPKNSQTLEDSLIAKGWVQINDMSQDITELLDESKYQPDIVYQRQLGKVNCTVRIGFNKYDTEQRKVFVGESCERAVHIFGGY